MDKEIISSEALENLNSSIKNLFDATSRVLEEAGIPHTDTTTPHADAAALGVSTSVEPVPFNPAPWVGIGLFFFISISLIVTAFIKNFHPETKAERISAAVDEIVSRRSDLPSSRQHSRTIRSLTSRIKKRSR